MRFIVAALFGMLAIPSVAMASSSSVSSSPITDVTNTSAFPSAFAAAPIASFIVGSYTDFLSHNGDANEITVAGTTIDINWGDGSADDTTANGGASLSERDDALTFDVTAVNGHTYATAGDFTITAGNSGSTSNVITVADPDGKLQGINDFALIKVAPGATYNGELCRFTASHSAAPLSDFTANFVVLNERIKGNAVITQQQDGSFLVSGQFVASVNDRLTVSINDIYGSTATCGFGIKIVQSGPTMCQGLVTTSAVAAASAK